MGIVYKAGKLLYHAGKLLMDCCVGACCVDGTCSQKSQCECSGTFKGVGSSCSPNPCGCTTDADCPEGETCVDGVCQPLTKSCCLWGYCYDIDESFTEYDCTYYGGSVVSGACVDNPCPPPETGACCDAYYGSCYETTEYDCYGTWKGPGTTCTSHPCAYPGACCVEGECQEVASEAACTELGGVYQGAYSTCEDGDCGERCCLPQSTCPGLAASYQCLEGYFAARCSALGGSPSEDCDIAQTHPGTGNPFCADGGPTSVTITIAGATVTSAPFQDVANAVNASFVLDLDCNLAQGTTLVDQVSVTVSGVTTTWYIFISFAINTSTGVVSVAVVVNSSNPPGSPPAAFGSAAGNSGAVLSPAYTNCLGWTIFDCTTYQLSAGLTGWSTSGGVVDFSGAAIAVA